MADELVDIVDVGGTVTSQAMKSTAHVDGLLHKTVIGYLRYGDDWALVRQAPHKQDAGQLVAPVGGHVQADESVESALLRESKEEIGVKSIEHTLVGVVPFHRQVIGRDENHLFYVYEITSGDDITLNDESVEIVRFTVQELKDELSSKPGEFGEAYYFILEKFYPEYLPGGWKKRWDVE